MKRVDFLRNVSLLLGGAVIPSVVTAIRHYDKYYLLQSFVRGFRYYEGPSLLQQMKEGDQLSLVREPDNKYDASAVAIYWNSSKIGFIPAEDNYMLSRLLDIGVPELMAEITHLNPDAASWENVSIAVSVLKERPAPPPENDPAQYLTVLKTPQYYSLKRKDKIITRFYTEETYSYDNSEDWYEFLVDNSANDGIYDYIHSNLSGTADYGVDDHVFALKRKDLNLLKIPEETVKKIELWMEKANVVFEEDYIALPFGEAEDLVKKISNLGEICDKAGNVFISLAFKN